MTQLRPPRPYLCFRQRLGVQSAVEFWLPADPSQIEIGIGSCPGFVPEQHQGSGPTASNQRLEPVLKRGSIQALLQRIRYPKCVAPSS